MRLSPAELGAIRKALEGVDCSRVFLFGSRTDDTARGGDMDLLGNVAKWGLMVLLPVLRFSRFFLVAYRQDR